MLIDTLSEWIGEQNIATIIDDAVSVHPSFNPDDPLRRTLPLHDFAELQRAIRRRMSAPRTQQVLTVAGRRVLHHLTEGRGVRMPRIIGVMKGRLADHVTNSLNYYTDYLNAVSDQHAEVDEFADGWAWRIRPYPLLDTDIRGCFELGMVEEMTTLATGDHSLPVEVVGQPGTLLELFIQRP